MIKIAIVEDEQNARKSLEQNLNTYAVNTNSAFDISCFTTADDFLIDSCFDFDLVFMDIEMPGIDGMTAAKKLRAEGIEVPIIFVTNVMQLARDGYLVGALDYIIKPIDSHSFQFTMQGIMPKIEQKQSPAILVKSFDGLHKIKVKDILYVEAEGHIIRYHIGGEIVEEWSSLKKVETELLPFGFIRAKNCFLVNPRYITEVEEEYVLVGGEKLKIGRSKKKEIMNKLNEYYSMQKYKA